MKYVFLAMSSLMFGMAGLYWWLAATQYNGDTQHIMFYTFIGVVWFGLACAEVVFAIFVWRTE